MVPRLEHLESDFDKAEYMQNMLLECATGGDAFQYGQLRDYCLSNPALQKFVPRWVRVNRNLGQFWQFTKNKHLSYAERRTLNRP